MNRSIFLLLVSTAPLAACNVSRHSADEQVSINADQNGEVSFSVPFAKGSMKLPEAVVANAHFDIDGVTMIPGGTIHGFNMNGGDKGAIVHLAFDAPKPPEQVRAYFLEQFRNKGDEATESGNSVAGKAKDGDQFVINVEPAPQGSSGTIAIHSKH